MVGSEFGRILVPVDNSRFSDISLDIALRLAERFGGAMVGFHAYAARLHEGRFRQLESSLPQRYQQPAVMERQRQAHASLISQGLEIVSRSYLDGCAARCREAGVAFQAKVAEGKNYAEIVKEAGNGYDLVVMGASGLGWEEGQPAGSVCLRVARRLTGMNIIVVREQTQFSGRIVVALDGSSFSQRGFLLALALAKAFGGEVEAVSAYDPGLHNQVFRNLVGVLSEEAGQMFHFEEQERLHEEVIDDGMAKLCREHLGWAERFAAQEGVPFCGEVLKGKATVTIARYVRQRRPCLVVAGRFGAHQTEGLDLGSTTEALLLSSSSNLLIGSNRMPWSPRAQERLEQVPRGIMRELTRQRVEEMAKRLGEHTVTPEVVEAKYSQWADGSAKAESQLAWTPPARERVQRVPDFVRGMVSKSIEDYARRKGATEVTTELVDEAKAFWERTGTVHTS
ncbi:MAG: universal stress protein [Chloroflexi bacterium]|nr:universal stress protein [Chloroflexota bacterium]